MKQIDPKSLPSTYITNVESQTRAKWFKDFKYPILNALTLLQEKKQENEKLDFSDTKTAIDFFKLLLTDDENGNKINGVRAYFASPASDDSVGQDKCGILTLIFAATTGMNSSDVPIYYILENGSFKGIEEEIAKNWVHNYQLIKREHLFKTLCDQDTIDNSKETKHVFFSYDQIMDTLEEIEYQIGSHADIVKGFGIRFTSYGNQNYQVGHSKPVKHKRRLTIGFTFINGKQEDIGIEDIDPAEFQLRCGKSFRSDTMDSGDPTPPPPTNNGENLDVSSD
jgi:hypothetical protein